MTGGLLVALALILFLAVRPLVKKVYQQKDVVEEAKLTLKRDLENVNKYREDLEYLNENRDLSSTLVVTDDNRVTFIENIENMAAEQNLELEIGTYSVTGKNKADNKNKIFLQINVKGSYDGFMKFLYKLQNSRYEILLEELNLERFEESKVKNMQESTISPENIPEIEGGIIISIVNS